MKECIFCELIKNSLTTAKIYEDEDTFIFLDKRPLFLGHSLIIPKIHFETFDDLPSHLIGPFYLKVQQLNKVVQVAMNAEGSFIAMNNKVSQSVPHLHVHVVPRNRGDGLRGFFWPRHQYQDEELSTTQKKLQDTWKKLHLHNE